MVVDTHSYAVRDEGMNSRLVFSFHLELALEVENLTDIHNLCTGGEADLDVNLDVDDMNRETLRALKRRMTAPKEGKRLWKMLTRRGAEPLRDVICRWVSTIDLI